MASVGFINTEDRSFEITPKRIKRTSDTVLTPEMKVIVTTDIHTTDPFYNGAKEIKEAYMRLYGFDYKKACRSEERRVGKECLRLCRSRWSPYH